jgi:hypothetical protein
MDEADKREAEKDSFLNERSENQMKATTRSRGNDDVKCEATMKPRAARRQQARRGYSIITRQTQSGVRPSIEETCARKRERDSARYGWRVAGPSPPQQTRRETLARFESMGTSNSAHRNTMITTKPRFSLSPFRNQLDPGLSSFSGIGGFFFL